MSEAYLGEIRIFGFTFAPVGWAFCDGQLLAVSQYAALFSIIGTFYGGNGQTTFALPNFQGRTGINQGAGPGLSTYVVGETSGQTTVTLNQSQLPSHNHPINTLTPALQTQEVDVPTPQSFIGNSHPDTCYSSTVTNPATSFWPNAIGVAGQGLPHDNMQPYLVLNFCIALSGVFPPRS